ncbi:MAG: transcriptional regulator GcvA [Gammaproteobacteria bacterium]|nr:transcriptional regulator GcvA [Gammaproteobacteria bacterium]
MSRRLPSLNAVRSFEAAARSLSFTKAAQELHVTQGAVSRMVQTLEQELGMPLFKRVGRSIELTPAGSAYYAQVGEALDRIAAATRALQRAQDGGMLSISVLPTFAMRWLVPRLSSFQQLYPDILVDVTASEHAVNFATESIDVAIRYGLGQWPDTEATRVMHDTVGVFCAPALLQGGTPLRTPADLPKHRLLQHTTRPEAWSEFFAACGLPSPNMRHAPGFEHFFMIIEAAATGMGAAILPLFLAHDELASGRLVQAFAQTHKRKHGYYLVHARAAASVRKIKVFKEWLIAEAKKS